MCKSVSIPFGLKEIGNLSVSLHHLEQTTVDLWRMVCTLLLIAYIPPVLNGAPQKWTIKGINVSLNDG